jgi:hypothetical protein
LQTYSKTNYSDQATIKVSVASLVLTKLAEADLFLRFLENQKISFVEWHSKILSALNQRNDVLLNPQLEKLIEVHPFYSVRKELCLAIAKFIFKTLAISPESIFDKSEVLATHFLRARLHLDYHFAKTLEAEMTGETAKQTWMDFVDFKVSTNPVVPYPDLKPGDFLFQNGGITQPVFQESFILNEYETDAGTAGVKISKCKWNEVLRECEDVSYGYAVACHYDFPAFKKASPNIHLTRTQTLLSGGAFCDFCIHDKKKSDKLEHPNKEFWDMI